MKDISTLVADIEAVLDAKTEHKVSEANVQAAGELFKEVLRNRFAARADKRGEDVIRFSSLGKPDRAMWYTANMPEVAETLPPKTYLKFLLGDIAEIALLFLAKEAGHTVTHEQHEVEVGGSLGHMDCVIDGKIVDAKTASPFAFGKFKSGTLPFSDSFGYIPQISGYAHALAEQENDPSYLEEAAFLAVEKVSGEICLSPVDGMTIKGNPPGPRIEHLKEVIASDTPPLRCFDPVPEGKSGNLRLGVECSYCPFKFECWKDSNNGEGLKTYFYSGGPKFLTRVVREPRVGSDG